MGERVAISTDTYIDIGPLMAGISSPRISTIGPLSARRQINVCVNVSAFTFKPLDVKVHHLQLRRS